MKSEQRVFTQLSFPERESHQGELLDQQLWFSNYPGEQQGILVRFLGQASIYYQKGALLISDPVKSS